MEKDQKIEVEKNCCENKDTHNCCHKMSCCKMKNCYIFKVVAFIIIIIIAFCLGSAWGTMKYRSGYNGYRGGMMNWGYGNFDARKNLNTDNTGQVTVTVSDEVPVQ